MSNTAMPKLLWMMRHLVSLREWSGDMRLLQMANSSVTIEGTIIKRSCSSRVCVCVCVCVFLGNFNQWGALLRSTVLYLGAEMGRCTRSCSRSGFSHPRKLWMIYGTSHSRMRSMNHRILHRMVPPTPDCHIFLIGDELLPKEGMLFFEDKKLPHLNGPRETQRDYVAALFLRNTLTPPPNKKSCLAASFVGWYRKPTGC